MLRARAPLVAGSGGRRHTSRSRPVPSAPPTRQRQRPMGGEQRQRLLSSGLGVVVANAANADGADAAASSSSSSSRPVDWRATGLCFALPALAGALFGADIGGTSGAVVSLTGPYAGADWAGSALSPLQSGAVVSASLFGALAASAAALASNDRLGRRTELAAAGALYALGAASAALSPSFPALVAGRAVYGCGIGLAMHAAPAYISETAPASVRGLLVALKEAAIVAGILAGYVAGAALAGDGDVGGWRNVYACAVPPALLLLAGAALLIPESPRFLLLSGKGRAAAADALRRAEGSRAALPSDVDSELAAVEAALNEAREAERVEAARTGGGRAWFLQPGYRRPLTVGLSLVVLQQLTGQPSVLYYAASIFNAAGFAGGDGAKVAVGLGAFKLVMTLAAVLLVDKAGRRPLLLGGVSGMTAALVLLSAAQAGAFSGGGEAGSAAAAAAAAGAGPDAAALVSVAALLLYVGCYQLSFGPISWLLVGELFPLGRRGQAIAAAVLVNFGTNALVSLALPQAQAALGPSATYAVFAGVGVFAVLLINAIVPETRGKTLEEIEALWATKEEGGGEGAGRSGSGSGSGV